MAESMGYVEVPFGRLFYERRGQGLPVVWLHAGYLDRRMWDPQFERFSPQYDLVRYDRRGFGRSDPVRTEYSDGTDLGTLLDRLGIASAYLVGLSDGGRVALDFAVVHPDRVDGLVVVAAGVSGYEPADEAEARQWEEAERQETEINRLAREAGTDVALPKLVDRWAHAVDRPTQARLSAIALENRARAFGPEEARERSPDPPAFGRLGSITAPTLVVTGERDLPVFGRVAEQLVDRLPNASRVEVKGADHMVSLSGREEFDTLLGGFFSRLDFMALQRGTTR